MFSCSTAYAQLYVVDRERSYYSDYISLQPSYYSIMAFPIDSNCNCMVPTSEDFEIHEYRFGKCMYYIRPLFTNGEKKVYLNNDSSYMHPVNINVSAKDMTEPWVELPGKSNMFYSDRIRVTNGIIVRPPYGDTYNNKIWYKVLSYVVEIHKWGKVVYRGYADNAYFPEGFREVIDTLKLEGVKVVFSNVTAQDDLGNIVERKEAVFEISILK